VAGLVGIGAKNRGRPITFPLPQLAVNRGVATDLLYHKLAPLLIAMSDRTVNTNWVNAAADFTLRRTSRDIDTF
jgi:hypothetical protein